MSGSTAGRDPRQERVGRLSEDEVERRLGGGAGLTSQTHLSPRTRTTRRGLVLDTATILGGVALMLVAAQVLSPAAPLLSSTSSPSGASEIAIGSLGGGTTFPPLDTLGPSPSPAVTLPATGPAPTPPPTAKPTQKPTARPTASPRPTPTPTPRVTAAVTPTPPPGVASFDCTVAGLALTCDGSASAGAASFSWDWGDGSPLDSGQKQLAHTYGSAGTYVVSLTVTPPGPDSVLSKPYTVGP